MQIKSFHWVSRSPADVPLGKVTRNRRLQVGHQERCGDTFTGHVGHQKENATVIELHDVVIVAADVKSGVVQRSDLHVIAIRQLGGK